MPQHYSIEANWVPNFRTRQCNLWNFVFEFDIWSWNFFSLKFDNYLCHKIIRSKRIESKLSRRLYPHRWNIPRSALVRVWTPTLILTLMVTFQSLISGLERLLSRSGRHRVPGRRMRPCSVQRVQSRAWLALDRRTVGQLSRFSAGK